MRNQAVVLLVLLALPPAVHAAQVEPLRPGQQIRIATVVPPGASPQGGGYQIPGHPVGRNREGVTLPLEGEALTYAVPGRALTGTLLAMDRESLTVKLGGGGEPVTVMRAAITRLEIRQPGRSRGAGAGVGLLVGGAAGALLGLAGGDDDPGIVSFSAGDKAAIFGVLGAGVGALVGFAAGGGGSWVGVDPAAGVRVSVGPARGDGISAQVRIGF